MLRKDSDMWSGHLGKVVATEHRIEIEPETKQSHQMPYLQVLLIREKKAEFVKDQVDKGVIEPTESECASLVVFVPNIDG